VIREFKMIARRMLKNEYSEIIDCARAAVKNCRFYYVLVMLAISAFVIAEPDWIDHRGMYFLIVLFACIGVLPEIQ